MYLISWPGGSWEATLRLSLTILAIYLAALWVTLVFWTYRDIRQRTRDPIIQTVAVILVLVFFLPGHWIYLILRPRYTLSELYERSLEEEALLQELEDQKACPNCNRRVQEEFLSCPFCRTTLKEPCRSCTRPLNRAWIACPFCGVEKPAPVRHTRQAASVSVAGRSASLAPRSDGRGERRKERSRKASGATEAEGAKANSKPTTKTAFPTPKTSSTTAPTDSGMIDATGAAGESRSG